MKNGTSKVHSEEQDVLDVSTGRYCRSNHPDVSALEDALAQAYGIDIDKCIVTSSGMHGIDTFLRNFQILGYSNSSPHMWLLDFGTLFLELYKRHLYCQSNGLKVDVEWTDNFLFDALYISREWSGQRYLFRLNRESWDRGLVFCISRQHEGSGPHYFRLDLGNYQPIRLSGTAWNSVIPDDLQIFAGQVHQLLLELNAHLVNCQNRALTDLYHR